MSDSEAASDSGSDVSAVSVESHGGTFYHKDVNLWNLLVSAELYSEI